MSLYQVQKLIYQLNRDPRTRERYGHERDTVLSEYELTDEERRAFLAELWELSGDLGAFIKELEETERELQRRAG